MTGTRPRTTTRRDLLRLTAALVVLTVLTAAFALAAFARAQDAADTVRADTAPGVIEVALARAALVEADRAAMTSFESGAVRLSGPGDDYRDQIAIAGQHLTRAAAHEVGDGGAGQQKLELVNALVAAYSSSVEQAASSFRHSETTPLWSSDLWTASRLLHADGGGVLVLLDQLRDEQIEKLDTEVDSAVNAVTTLSWVLPGIALLVLLGVAQVHLSRRFRRTINVGLAAGSLCVLAMLAFAAVTSTIGSRLDDTRDAVHELQGTWDQQVIARVGEDRQTLAELIGATCDIGAGACGSTVQQVLAGDRGAAPVGGHQDTSPDGSERTDGSERIRDAAAAASGYGGYLGAIPLAAVAALAGIAAGMYVRIAEYRYRGR